MGTSPLIGVIFTLSSLFSPPFPAAPILLLVCFLLFLPVMPGLDARASSAQIFVHWYRESTSATKSRGVMPTTMDAASGVLCEQQHEGCVPRRVTASLVTCDEAGKKPGKGLFHAAARVGDVVHEAGLAVETFKTTINGRLVSPTNLLLDFTSPRRHNTGEIYLFARCRGGKIGQVHPAGPRPAGIEQEPPQTTKGRITHAARARLDQLGKPSLAHRSPDDDKGSNQWNLVSANITTYAHAAKVAATCDADIFLFQELMRGGEAGDSMVANANAHLCHAIVHPSKKTDAGGLSAGVAVWSRWACGLAAIPHTPSFANPCPERFVIAQWGGVTAFRRIGWVSILVRRLRPVEPESRTVAANFGVLRSNGKPFILGGDWQTHPDLLRENGWPALTQVTVVAPDEHTYRSGDTSSTIDYFVVSDLLAAYAVVTCKVRPDAGGPALIPKHRPVTLTIRGTNKSRIVRVAKAPPPIPTEPAVGCRRLHARPLNWQAAKDLALLAPQGASQLAAAYDAFNTNMEAEVLDAVGMSVSESSSDIGKRGTELEIVKKSAFALPPEKVKAGQQANTFRKFQRELEQWAQMVSDGRYTIAWALWNR